MIKNILSKQKLYAYIILFFVILMAAPIAIEYSLYSYCSHIAGKITIGDTIGEVERKTPLFTRRKITGLTNGYALDWFNSECPEGFSIHELDVLRSDNRIHIAYDQSNLVCALFPSYE